MGMNLIKKVKTLTNRKRIIATKTLYYNCTGTGHGIADCKSKRNCKNWYGARSSYASATLAEIIQPTTYQIYLSNVSQKR